MDADEGRRKKQIGRVKSCKNKLDELAHWENSPKRKRTCVYNGTVTIDGDNDDGDDDRGEDEDELPTPTPALPQPSVQQLQEEIQSLQLRNEVLEHEVQQSTLQSSVGSDKKSIEQCRNKILEYQGALTQRDKLIGQLQGRLAECVQQRDDQQSDYLQQVEGLTREVNTLKAQLKETTDTINSGTWLTGVSQREHIQLKNKLIELQQNRTQDKELLEQLTIQLDHEKRHYGQLEYKYKSVLQRHKQATAEAEESKSELVRLREELRGRELEIKTYKETTGRLESELLALRETAEKIKVTYAEDLKRVETRHEEERRALEEQNTRLEEQNKTLDEEVKALGEKIKVVEDEAEKKVMKVKMEVDLVSQREQEAKEKAAGEVKELMQQAQEASTQLAEAQRQHEAQQAAAEEHLGNQLNLIKQQMSEMHQEEIAKIRENHQQELEKVREEVVTMERKNHEQELSTLSEQIEALEHTQKEDHSNLIQNMNSLNEFNHTLKSQLDSEKLKLSSMEEEWKKKEIEVEKLKINITVEIEAKVKAVRLTEELKNKLKETEIKFKETERRCEEAEGIVDSLKASIEQLSQELKVETERRTQVELKLSEEEHKITEILEKKSGLENKIAELSKQIDAFSSDLTQSKAEKEELNANLKEAENRHNQVLEELKESQKRIKELEGERDVNSRDKEALDGKKKQLIGENEKILEEKEKLLAEREKLIDTISQKSSELDEVKGKLEESKKQINVMKAAEDELKEVKKKLKELEKQVKAAQEEVKEAKEKLMEKEEQYDSMKVTQDVESDSLREKYLALIQKCGEDEERRKKYDEDCQKQMQSLNERLRNLDTMLAEAMKLSGQDQDAVEHAVTLEVNLQIVIGKLKEAEKNSQKLESIIKKVTTEKSQFEKALEKSQGEKFTLEEKIKILETVSLGNEEKATVIKQLNNKIEENEELIKQLNSKIEDLQKECTIEREKVVKANHDWKEEVSQLKADRDIIEKQMKENQNEREKLLGVKEDMLKELEVSREALDSLEGHKKEVEMERKKLQLKLEELSLEMQKIKNENSKLEKEKNDVIAEEDELKVEKEEISQELAKLKEIKDINSKLEEQNKKVTAERDKLKAEKKEVSHELAKLREANDITYKQSHEVEAEKERLMSEKESVSQELIRVKGELDELEKQKNDLVVEINRLVIEKKEVEKKLSEHKAVSDRIENEKNEVVAERNKLLSDLEHIKSQVTQLKESYDIMEKENNEMIVEKDKLLVERDGMLNELSEVKAAYDMIEKEKNEGDVERVRLLAERKEALHELSHIKEVDDMVKQQKNGLEVKKEELMRELHEVRAARDLIEQQKNEIEMERDRLVEEYSVMKQKLEEALIALDRQVSIPTHPHLTSQTDVSVSTSTSLNLTHDTKVTQAPTDGKNIDSQDSLVPGNVKRPRVNTVDVSVQVHCQHSHEGQDKSDSKDNANSTGTKCKHCEELNCDTVIKINVQMKEKIASLHKDRKELSNKMERLRVKINHQHFAIKSLENEKSKLKRRMAELESEKVALRAEREKQNLDRKDKLDLQRQVNELNMIQQQTNDLVAKHVEEISRLKETLSTFVEDDKATNDKKLTEIVSNLGSLISESESRRGSDSSDFLRDCTLNLSEELNSLSEDHKQSLGQLLQTQEELDRLRMEKLQMELVNINLAAEVERLKGRKGTNIDFDVEIELAQRCNFGESDEKELELVQRLGGDSDGSGEKETESMQGGDKKHAESVEKSDSSEKEKENLNNEENYLAAVGKQEKEASDNTNIEGILSDATDLSVVEADAAGKVLESPRSGKISISPRSEASGDRDSTRYDASDERETPDIPVDSAKDTHPISDIRSVHEDKSYLWKSSLVPNPEENLKRLQVENERLRGQLQREAIVSQLEKLNYRSPKLKEESERVLERGLVIASVKAMLEQLAAEWDTLDTTPSSLFLATQAQKVRCIAEQVCRLDDVWDSRVCVEAAMRLLQQAVIRGVCGDYSNVVKKTVVALDETINNTLHQIKYPNTTLPTITSPHATTTKAPTGGGGTDPKLTKYDTICFDTPYDATHTDINGKRLRGAGKRNLGTIFSDISPSEPKDTEPKTDPHDSQHQTSQPRDSEQCPQPRTETRTLQPPNIEPHTSLSHDLELQQDSLLHDDALTMSLGNVEMQQWANQVAQLIDVRTTLVEAATEFEAELECAVRERVTVLQHEVEQTIKAVNQETEKDPSSQSTLLGQEISTDTGRDSLTSLEHHNEDEEASLREEDGQTSSTLHIKDPDTKDTATPTKDSSPSDAEPINKDSIPAKTITPTKDSTTPPKDSSTPSKNSTPTKDSTVVTPDMSNPTPPGDSVTSPHRLTQIQQQFIKEFREMSRRIHQEAEEEKLEMLRNQKAVVHNILEDNKAKLHTLCQEYLQRLAAKKSVKGAMSCGGELVCALEERLASEAGWVDEKYEELLQQYMREQAARTQHHIIVTQAHSNRLTSILNQKAPLQGGVCVEESEGDVSEEQVSTDSMGDLQQLEAEVKRLEAQLEARDTQALESLDSEVVGLREQIHHDLATRSRISCHLESQLEHVKIQVTKRHLQGIYNDRDWYKRLVGLLSQVTLQLLHYYTVAQALTQPSPSHAPALAPTHTPHSAISPTQDPTNRPDSHASRNLDGSFVSEEGGDGWVEGGHYTSFTDDEAATTGLVGGSRHDEGTQDLGDTAGPGSVEGGSTCGSGLDSTGLSEGLLEDLDKDQQLRPLLTRTCPHLLAVLGGRWEKVDLPALEKEAQELAISLQAAAGMINIFIHSTHSNPQVRPYSVHSPIDFSQHALDTSTSTLREEKEEEGEVEGEDKEKKELMKTEEKKLGQETMTQVPQSDQARTDTPDLSEYNLTDLTNSIRELLSEGTEKLEKVLTQDDLDYTRLKQKDTTNSDRLRRTISQPGAKDDLQLYLHQLIGRLEGMKEQQAALEEENQKLLHTNKTLACQLQVAQDELEEVEENGGGQGGASATSPYAAKMEATKDLREKVRSMLSAKKKSNLGREELIERVGELEGVVTAVVTEADASIAKLKAQVDDLTQQLETADRQLRSSRQFLEQQASERDQEAEELEGKISRLSAQLREKEAQLTSSTNFRKEVESLERQLREKSQELEAARIGKEALQAENKAAQDKIRDLREIIGSLEGQVDRRGVAEADLRERIIDLETALSQAHTQTQTLAAQLEELRYSQNEEKVFLPDPGIEEQEDSDEEEEVVVREREETPTGRLPSTSLFNELQEDTDFTLLEMIEEHLEKTTRSLQTMQDSPSHTPPAAIQERAETPMSGVSDDGDVSVRTLSPGSLQRRLEGLLVSLGRVAEAVAKKFQQTKAAHTELTLQYEEVVSERDAAEARVRGQVVTISGLEARVEELRHTHPTTEQTTAHLTTRLTRMQEELDDIRAQLTSKAREVEELKHTLGVTRAQLLAREEELERVQNQAEQQTPSQPTTEQLMVTNKQLQEDLVAKADLINKLEAKVRTVQEDGSLPSDLAASLVAGKNAQLEEQAQEVVQMRAQMTEKEQVVRKLNEEMAEKEHGIVQLRSEVAEKEHKIVELKANIVSTLKLVNSGNSTHAAHMLSKMVQRERVSSNGCVSSSGSEGLKSPEILRRSAPEDEVSVQTVTRDPLSVKGNLDGMSPVSIRGVSEGEEMPDQSQPSSADFTLMSTHTDSQPRLSKVSRVTEERKQGKSPQSRTSDNTTPEKGENGVLVCVSEGCMSVGMDKCNGVVETEVAVLRDHVDVLQREVVSLTHYQARLEADYREAQKLLEERDAELEALTGEMEDQLAPPPSPRLLQACRDLEQQNAELQDRLAELEVARQEEAERVKTELEEERGRFTEERGSFADQKEKFEEERRVISEEREIWIQERQKAVEEIKKLMKEREGWINEKGKKDEEIIKLDLTVQQLKTEIEEVRRSGTEMREDGERLREKMKEKEREVEELRSEGRRRKAQLERRNVEIEKLKTKVRGSSVDDADTEREVRQLHQHYQEEITTLKDEITALKDQITALKEQLVLREKQLCSDYEERMAAQVNEVSSSLIREHEAAVCRQREMYEAELQGARQDTEHALALLHQQQQQHVHSQPIPPTPNNDHNLSELCENVDALVAQVKEQLEKSGRLDDSLAQLTGRRPGVGDSSTRASSVGSDGSDVGETEGHVATRIQTIMGKLHQQGIEMLTLVELMFLQKHGSHLDSSQRSLVATSASTTALSNVGAGERTHLVSHVARLEEELAKKDRDAREKIEGLEWQVEQEQMSAREWQLSYEGERRRGRESMEQLRQEKLAAADQAVEITRLHSQLSLTKMEYQKANEKVTTLNEKVESLMRQVEGLESTLDGHRSNFTRVSKALNQQRKLATLEQSQKEILIEDLRKTLEKEREKIVSLYSRLEEARNQPTPHTSTTQDLQVQLTVEQNRRREAELACERERMKAATVKEEAQAEQARARVELVEEQGRVTQLTKAIRNAEGQRQDLYRKLSQEREHVQHLESQLCKAEGDVRRLEAELNTKSKENQEATHRLRDEAHKLHLTHTRTINKLGEAEAEVCRLRQEVSAAIHEVEAGKQREDQVKRELYAERTANDRLGLPALARVKNMDEFMKTQFQENLELCKSVLRLTEWRQQAQARIHTLEDTVDRLKAKLRHNNNNITTLQAAGGEMEEEMERTQRDIEAARTRTESRLTGQMVGRVTVDEDKLRYVYGQYVRAEHQVKALTWQKRYLMATLRGYANTEAHTVARLNSLAAQYHPHPPSLPPPSTLPHRRHYKFRVVALGVVAVVRMRALVERNKRKKRLGVQMLLAAPTQPSPLPTIITPTPENSRPGSSSSFQGARVLGTMTGVGEAAGESSGPTGVFGVGFSGSGVGLGGSTRLGVGLSGAGVGLSGSTGDVRGTTGGVSLGRGVGISRSVGDVGLGDDEIRIGRDGTGSGRGMRINTVGVGSNGVGVGRGMGANSLGPSSSGARSHICMRVGASLMETGHHSSLIDRSGAWESFTGHTPPTKGPPTSNTTTTAESYLSRRSLFPESESRNLNEYIERLDTIHSTLGIQPKRA